MKAEAFWSVLSKTCASCSGIRRQTVCNAGVSGSDYGARRYLLLGRPAGGNRLKRDQRRQFQSLVGPSAQHNGRDEIAVADWRQGDRVIPCRPRAARSRQSAVHDRDIACPVRSRLRLQEPAVQPHPLMLQLREPGALLVVFQHGQGHFSGRGQNRFLWLSSPQRGR